MNDCRTGRLKEASQRGVVSLRMSRELCRPDAIFADVSGAVAILNDSLFCCRRRARGRSSHPDYRTLPTWAPSLLVMVGGCCLVFLALLSP